MGYLNADGLYKKYGTDKAVANVAGEYRTPGDLREVQVILTLANLTQSEVIQSDVQVIPAGARIKEVEVLTHTAGATGTAIDLGLIKTDRTTEIDYDGLLAAMPIAAHNSAGERTIYSAVTTVPASATGTGALIGTTTAFTGHITCSRTDATAYTAGVLRVTIRYYMP
jgi:hypothetical protein